MMIHVNQDSRTSSQGLKSPIPPIIALGWQSKHH